jgi:hypothetical protein
MGFIWAQWQERCILDLLQKKYVLSLKVCSSLGHILIQLPQGHKIRCPLTNCHKAKQTSWLKKFPTADWLTARKTDAPAESAGYEMLYHPFNALIVFQRISCRKA